MIILKKTIINIIIILAFFGLGIFAGAKITKTINEPQNEKIAYQKALEDLQDTTVENNTKGDFQKIEDISNLLVGKIQTISEDSIVLEANLQKDHSGVSNDIRIVKVSDITVFYQFIEKNSKEYEKGNVLSLSDLKVGQRVFIEASEDISDKKEFVAVSISVMPVAVK